MRRFYRLRRSGGVQLRTICSKTRSKRHVQAKISPLRFASLHLYPHA